MPEASWRRIDLDRVTARVRAVLAPADGTLQRIAEAVQFLTGGWEPLVEAVLTEGPAPWDLPAPPVAQLARPGGPVAELVVDSLLPELDEPTRRLLDLLAGLTPVPRRLVVDLHPGLLSAYDDLLTRHLIDPAPDGTPRLVPLVSAALAQPAAERRDWLGRCADWFADRRLPGPALHAAGLGDDAATCARLVEEHGDRITRSGWARDVLAALPRPPEDASERLLVQWAHAARVAGSPLLAHRTLQALATAAETNGLPQRPDLGWRLAQVHYGRGHYDAAVRLCREPPDPRATESHDDHAMRLATLSIAWRALGERDRARDAAEQAVDVGRRSGEAVDDAATGLALLAQALLHGGARRLNLLADALTHAEFADDLILTQRVLVNLADAHLVAAEYAAALDRADQAIALVHRIGSVGCHTVALHNRAEALLGLGEIGAARTSFQRCLDLARRHGVARTPAALHGLAECDYQAGLIEDAEIAFREAADLAGELGDDETLAPVLARLATILATRVDPAAAEPGEVLDEAHRMADLAIVHAEPDHVPAALVARGWVAVAAQDPDAPDRAEAALTAAREHQVRRMLGEALELRAAATADPREALRWLEQAIETYERAGSVGRGDRVRLVAARLPLADRAQRSAGRSALRRLRRADGVPAPHHPGGTLAEGHATVRVLGSFQVQVDGRPVDGSAWRSRQARTLLKLLVSRDGRSVSRDELCELLWPDDDPAKTGHRLSVLLSTLRSALDPTKRWPPDRFLLADGTGIRVVTDHVTVDVHDFLADAADAISLADAGEEQAARTLLTDLLTEHTGEAFEDDPFEAWAQEARDHVRNVQVQCLRTAARLGGRAGDVDQAITLLTRLLAVDPYDEPAHRLLVAALDRAGRHGEAERAYERWSRANADLGLPAPARCDRSLTPR